ncbi:MAG: hypothetical protein AAB339_13095 [Elusimicrobiota bacterium]
MIPAISQWPVVVSLPGEAPAPAADALPEGGRHGAPAGVDAAPAVVEPAADEPAQSD